MMWKQNQLFSMKFCRSLCKPPLFTDWWMWMMNEMMIRSFITIITSYITTTPIIKPYSPQLWLCFSTLILISVLFINNLNIFQTKLKTIVVVLRLLLNKKLEYIPNGLNLNNVNELKTMNCNYTSNCFLLIDG